VIETAIGRAKGRCQVIAGTGSNSTAEAISLTRAAERLGADAALLVAPYYNKPSQEGVYRHYRAIAGAVGLPIILYSIPGRCGSRSQWKPWPSVTTAQILSA
jgi:4-hydroxy-tetrahydrodipicolinate synthase